MKKPIDWHESCLFNANVNLQAQLESVRQRIDDCSRLKAKIDFLTAQIAEAKRRGITEFDGDRFMKKIKDGGK